MLKGVGIPVASAILTVIFPEEYCVIDYRVWRTLLWMHSDMHNLENYSCFSELTDCLRKYTTIDSYSLFLEVIRKFAEENNTTRRKIEMALWAYDKERGLF